MVKEGVNFNGLSHQEAQKRLAEYGLNEIKDTKLASPFKIFLRQIKRNFVLYLLLVSMILSFVIGKSITGYTILGVMIIVVGVGFMQEYKAEKAVSALKSMITPFSVVIRDGKEVDIPSSQIVLGDVLVLRTGEKVPADAVVLEEKELKLNESALTGESEEVEKKVCKSTLDCGRDNTIFMGTFVVNGRCLARVVHTGMNTEFGKIASLVSSAEKELPLQKKVEQIAKYMTVVGLFLAIITGVVMILKDSMPGPERYIDALLVVIAISIASFPEGFPVTLITALSSGAFRMAKKNAIVNRMSIIETLGETTVICSDKTGTLTKGEMTVKKVYVDDKIIDVSGAGYEGVGEFNYKGKIDPGKEATLNLMIKAGVLCNDSKIERTGEDDEYKAVGSPTECALLVLGAKAGIFEDDLKYERVEELPFSSERKIMSVLCNLDKRKYVFVKGAPEMLIKKCKFVQRNDGVFKLTEDNKKRITALNEKFNSGSLRSIAIAYKMPESFKKDHFEEDLIFLGLAGMEDPPKEDVDEAIKVCHSAGIAVKMITGDSKETAVAIGKEIGITGIAITGEELDNISENELANMIKDISIFARVNPGHKMKIVKALKANGEIVTMTGDGVNDAPALKEAHIGVAMGKSGTDVSRSVADLVLKDDHFATIVAAVKEGRTIFSNIQKFSVYQLSINVAQACIVLFAILMGLPMPLAAMQILFMNLVSDEITAITLSFNPPSLDVMRVGPRKKKDIIDKNLFAIMMLAGMSMCIVALGVFYSALNVLHVPEIEARSMAFVTMVLLGLANVFNFRSFRYPTYKLPVLANKPLAAACGISLLLTAVIFLRPLRGIFEISAVDWRYLMIIVPVSLVVIVMFDIIKTVKAMRNKEHKFLNLEII
jgi:Ca2+-transporting ATPase